MSFVIDSTVYVGYVEYMKIAGIGFAALIACAAGGYFMERLEAKRNDKIRRD